ncbi:MAG: LptA/OstA family protein [Gammaproteobacteria bacterium]|uniref:Organic solvent tolerance-like N-terminal domain-containing protein n=1 Tax=SAR86 cluster bacterium TaxID=2030880 RepID=A0A520N1K0_9GAMM|nr:hypothetical protein [Gammaproteobacteria bacterium]MBA4730292.1 hypothetical protein [SAR86 cluster bacterium]RPG34924.1 MAG: hypothetical protein CBD53_001550 [Gammaproteobacteria bacterium TMED193]RZO27350.1 MAG: hypothetical protein EVA92_00985 [SAR86 cluster bacterium]|tara:strand:+ start:202 stop:573 length:372 start_codon:yes stop_codon:yes gene_type:complete
MLYRLFFLLLPFFVFSQEYEIKSSSVEIDTDSNKLIYTGDVVFSSDDVTFEADRLVILQENEEFIAVGTPIKLTYIENGETILGVSSNLKMISGIIELYNDAQLIRSDTKIISESIKINLNND